MWRREDGELRVNDLTAIRVQNLASHVTCVVRGQEHLDYAQNEAVHRI